MNLTNKICPSGVSSSFFIAFTTVGFYSLILLFSPVLSTGKDHLVCLGLALANRPMHDPSLSPLLTSTHTELVTLFLGSLDDELIWWRKCSDSKPPRNKEHLVPGRGL